MRMKPEITAMLPPPAVRERVRTVQTMRPTPDLLRNFMLLKIKVSGIACEAY